MKVLIYACWEKEEREGVWEGLYVDGCEVITGDRPLELEGVTLRNSQ